MEGGEEEGEAIIKDVRRVSKQQQQQQKETKEHPCRLQRGVGESVYCISF